MDLELVAFIYPLIFLILSTCKLKNMKTNLLLIISVLISQVLKAQIYTNGNGVTDIDGNTYTTIVLNGQEWMQENLNVSKFSNGDAIDNVTDGATWYTLTTPAWAFYNNDNIYEQYYGRIYNWYVVNDGRNVCPTGWHVPTDNEWKSLEIYLGMTQAQADNTSWRGVDEGVKLKSDFGWNSNGNGTNESGFVGLPGGRRNPGGNFSDLGNQAKWWTSTGEGSLPYQKAYERGLLSIYDKIYRIGTPVKVGAYIRCLNDNLVGINETDLELIQIYPNPVTSILTVKMPQNIIASSYQIYDLSGKQLKQGRIELPLTTIDLSELENGIYTIKFEDFLEIHRIVKQ
jgi:uncharacterized protein (TIGR02145 family)